MVRIGVLGAGPLAQAFAYRAIAAGHTVLLSNRSGPDSLQDVVAALGPSARAVSRFEAAEEDTVLLAVPGHRAIASIQDLPPWGGRTLVDATNNFLLAPPLPGESSSSEAIADRAAGANVVKALNTVFASRLLADPEPVPGWKRVLFVSGDDVPSKESFRALLHQMGWFTVDLGGLAEGSRYQQLPGGALGGLELLHPR